MIGGARKESTSDRVLSGVGLNNILLIFISKKYHYKPTLYKKKNEKIFAFLTKNRPILGHNFG